MINNDGRYGKQAVFPTSGERPQLGSVSTHGEEAQIAQFTEDVSSFDKYPQGSKPTKDGVHTNSYKLLRKFDDDTLDTFQVSGKHIIKTRWKRNVGASGHDDYGGPHESIRLIQAQNFEQGYVYRSIASPVEGSYAKVTIPPAVYTTVETAVLGTFSHKKDTYTISSKSGQVGLGAYEIAPNTSVTVSLPLSKLPYANLLYYTTPTSSDSVELSWNDSVLDTFDPSGTIYPSGNYAAIRQFEVPRVGVNGGTINLKIANKSATKKFYVCALNYSALADYTGLAISDYKFIGSDLAMPMNHIGASGYAMVTAPDGKILGEYHGGEVSEENSITWDEGYTDFDSITKGAYSLVREAKMTQHLNQADGRATMLTEWDWNVDGTVTMNFSWENKDIKVSTFYTALNCTNTAFNVIDYPVHREFNLSNPSDKLIPIPIIDGKVRQADPKSQQWIDLRFSKFNTAHNERGSVLYDGVAYRKYYYGAVYLPHVSDAVYVPLITFSKSIDFYRK